MRDNTEEEERDRGSRIKAIRTVYESISLHDEISKNKDLSPNPSD